MLWVWRWLLLVMALAATTALPVPDEIVDTSTKLLGSSVVTSVSVVMGHEDGAGEKASEKLDTRKATEDLPPSPVNLLKPDGFQFYTVDEKGQLITRQMTDSEIQSIIAAGGGPFPIETQDPQKTGDNETGELKVADVVQNVQNVLKGELNKPATAMGTVPTIPGHANDEWSSILPSILGGDSESAPVSLPEIDDKPVEEVIKQNVSAVEKPVMLTPNTEKLPVPETPEEKPQETESPSTERIEPIKEETKTDEMVKIEQNQQMENTEKPLKTEEPSAEEPEETPERPMIQVPVITADSVQSTTKKPSVYEEKPIYHILNTISAEEMKDKDAQDTQEAGITDRIPEKNETTAIPEKESSNSSPVIVSVTEKTENEVTEASVELPSTTAASSDTIMEMVVTSNFTPSIQESSNKLEASSALLGTEETKPTVDTQSVKTPSITLEAPEAAGKPVDPAINTEEKEPQVIPVMEKEKNDKNPAVDEKAPGTQSQETETTTSAITIEQEVSKIINLIPESISSIVDDLISDGTKDEVKTEANVIDDNVQKQPEAPTTQDETKTQDSMDKTDDSTPSVSEASGDSNDKVTSSVVPVSEQPETKPEPVIQMQPELKPDSSVTEIAEEAEVPPKNIESKPEPDKIMTEETISGDKVEQETGADTKSEIPQNLIPVNEVASSVTEPQDSVTDKNDNLDTETTTVTAEKKPEPLFTELADSVSSMISQVSEILPSMVPIPQKSETDEQPVKRVEDGIKIEETSISKGEEESAKPLDSIVESPTKQEAAKPEETSPELVMVEIKNPEPTTIKSVIGDSEATKITDIASIAIPEPNNSSNDKLESPEIETPSESSSDIKNPETETPENGNIEETGIAAENSGSTKISESSSGQEPVKSEDTSPSKPVDSKPEKVEIIVKKGNKTETIDFDAEAEAPIVRIDITEAKPTDSAIKNDDSTESSVVRIQLTDPVATINQMIDSAPEMNSPVEVQEISFPEKNVLEVSSAQNAGSDLIAGPQPSNPTVIKSPEDSVQLDTPVSTVNQMIETSRPTETATDDSQVKTPLKPDLQISSDDKSQQEIANTKIPEIQVTQATTQTKLEANDEADKESLIPETEISQTTENFDQMNLEKPVEIQNLKETATPVEKPSASAEPTVKIHAPVPGDEKIESSMKGEDDKKPAQTTKIIVEPVAIIPEEKVEQTNRPEAVKIPTVEDAPAIVPQEVVVSTTVDIQPSTESAETIKDEPLKLEERPEPTNTKIAPESIDISENKPEADNTVTKINDTPSEHHDLVPVELVIPAPAQSDVQSSDHTTDVSTPVAVSGDKMTEKPVAQEEIETQTTAQIDSEIKNTKITEKKPEVPDVKKESEAVKESGESTAKPEEVQAEEPKNPTSGNELEKKIPVATIPERADIEESAVEKDALEKDQASVPLVRIDVSPEKSQPESTIMKVEEISENANSDNKETEKPEALVSIDKPKDDSVMENSSVQSVEPVTTASSLESSSKAPAEANIKETEVQLIPTKEPEVVVKETEEDVKKVTNIVDSKQPEMTAAIETTSSAAPIPIKIENEKTTKPGIKVDSVPNITVNNTPVKTQEIRIQVNDTAVLVTKQKIPHVDQNDEKKVQTAEIPEKIQVLNQPPEKPQIPSQPTKLPGVEKPTAITKPQPTDKTTSKQDVDKVKTESVQEQKKPAIDPYVKLGEKKQEQKPTNVNPLKTPVLGNKKPANTNTNKENEDKWTLIPQSESYPITKQQAKPSDEEPSKNGDVSVPLEVHHSAVSLDESTRDQDADISSFAKLCNELAFSFWIAANNGLSTARSLALSPFGMTSMLAMVFLGARGPTSGQMNDILKLDDVVTFNPHLVFQNVSDSVNLARGQGIANAAFVRELFADRLKAGRLLPFYKERAQQFYDGHVEEVNFATISDLVRRRTNLLIRRQTGGRIRDFVKGNVMALRSPLAALSANVFQTDCTGASSDGRDGEMYFAVLPAVRQRKLVPVPATVWRSGVLAGYEPGLDATVISLGGVGNLVSTIFLLPGQQGLAAPDDSLDLLEKRLLEGAFTHGVWDRLLRVLIPRMGVEVQVPKFSHRSVVNATAALKRMGLDDLFSKHADLKGINGIGNDLHLADMLQINLFSTCGDEVITGGRHHVEIYPASPLRGARGDRKTVEIQEPEEEELELSEIDSEEKRTRRSLKVEEYVQGSRNLEKRASSPTAEKRLLPEDYEDEERSQRASNPSKELSQLSKGKQNNRPLLKLDRPFLYFVRHNPTGMILHMGRFNPRLMP